MPDSNALPDPNDGRTGFVPPDFRCSWTDGGLDAGWVQITGELDIATTPELERTLLEPQLQTHLVVLDLRELAFMDTSGVHAIVNASIRARKAGHRLVLVHGSPDINRLFTMTGSSDDVEIGDANRVDRPPQARQRSLVSLSLLRTG
jgi:anti-sigma B factor antagonist